MKHKKSKKILAAFLVLIQLALLTPLVSIPVYAENPYGNKREYTLPRTLNTPVLDGLMNEDEDWQYVPWSDSLLLYSGSNTHGCDAKFKAMWENNGTTAYIHVFLKVTDGKIFTNNGAWFEDSFQFAVDETDAATDLIGAAGRSARRTGNRVAFSDVVKNPDGSETITVRDANNHGYFFYVIRHTDDGFNVEMKYTLNNINYAAAGNTLAMDIWTTDAHDNQTTYAGQYAWNSKASPTDTMKLNQNGGDAILGSAYAGGTRVLLAREGNVLGYARKTESGKIVLPEMEFAGTAFAGWHNETTGTLYPAGYELDEPEEEITFNALCVKIETLKGAAARLDSVGISKSGIRYETRVDLADFAAISAFIAGTGTLIVPTDKIAAGHAFTAADLTEQSVHFEDIENDGWYNGETASADGYGKFYGSLVNILKSNYERNFSGVGYIEIRYSDGSTGIIYGGYEAAYHSRSIYFIITAALADAEAYTTDEIAVLNAMKVKGEE